MVLLFKQLMTLKLINADTSLDAVGIDVDLSRAGFEETYINC